MIGSHLGWGTIAVPSDEPSFVVASGELDECGSQLFDGVEGSHPQQVLFQGSDEALCDERDVLERAVLANPSGENLGSQMSTTWRAREDSNF